MDRESAIKATKEGAAAACVSAALTTCIVLYAIWNNDSGSFSLWNDASNIFDIIFVFVCAYAINRQSRAAATLLLIYFIASKIIMTLESGRFSGGVLALIFIYFYARAVYGAFVFHRIEKAENPNYKGAPKWVYFIGIPLSVIAISFLFIGIATMTGTLPSTEVQAGNQMLRSDIKILADSNIIENDETIEYYYSDSFSSILESGSILTNDRVIVYFTDDSGERAIYELKFNEIANIELIEAGNAMNDSIYQVNATSSQGWIRLVLSTTSRGDVRFVEALRAKVEAAKHRQLRSLSNAST